MDKEKQIEEIDSVIRGHFGCQMGYKMQFAKYGGWGGYKEVFTSDIAKDLYNAGYRKIPEGSVVLTENEVWEFREDSAKVKYLKKEIEKQAVKEFVQVINKEYDLFDDDDEIFFGCLRRDIKRISKEFGVEV